MIIADLSYLDNIAGAPGIAGGATTIEDVLQKNKAYVDQYSSSYADFSAYSFSVDGDLTVKSKSSNSSDIYQNNSIYAF